MRISFLFILPVVLCIACQPEDEVKIDLIGHIPSTDSAFQKKIVGQLSGEFMLENGEVIKSRWSEKERELSRNYLESMLTGLGLKAEVQHYISSNLNPFIDFLLDPYSGANVYATLAATEVTNEYIVLGAHYDSGKRSAPGAIDNATGIALISTILKSMKNLTYRSKNLLVVFFDQEEEELIGSSAFAELLLTKDWEINSIHCFDMVGWDGDGDFAMEDFSADPVLLDLYRKSAEKFSIPMKEITIDPVGYDNSSTDFDVFVPYGFKVIGSGECFYHRDYSPYKDTPEDTYQTVNFPYLLSCTRLIEDIILQLIES